MYTQASVRHTEAVAKMGCYTCGKDHEDRFGPLVSTGTIIDGEGHLLFCAYCVIAMGSLVGMLTPDDAAEVLKENKSLRKELSVTKMQLGKAKKALDLDKERESLIKDIKDSTSSDEDEPVEEKYALGALPPLTPPGPKSDYPRKITKADVDKKK